jgi:beta-glucanase (GH16 family)
MLKDSIKIRHKWSLSLFVFVIILLLTSCTKETKSNFTVDFSYELMDDNHVKFVNLSEGEYYSLDWDFANGETAATTDKNKTYTIYYPQAGEYNVSLSVLDYIGNIKSTSKTVGITKSDLILSFSATIDPAAPNYVNLVNTSIGNYDSSKWIYRNKEIENEISTVAYFPFAGNYEIELQVIKGTDTFSEKQMVTITRDDPDYGSNLTLSWADEFDETNVNTNDWTFETGATGWGNNELQNYTDGDNAKIENGILILTAKKVNDNTTVGSYTSTRMVTKGKKEFTYGKMEIRAKLPSGRGIWPAIWMLGGNIDYVGWPACGEIDIMEYVGYQPNTIYATVHTTSGSGSNGDGNGKTLETAEEEFHIYGLLWTEQKMVFYTDTLENVTYTYSPANKNDNNWPFNKPQYFILNVAVGGNWGGAQGIDNSIFPQSMEIDYVRVYQFND